MGLHGELGLFSWSLLPSHPLPWSEKEISRNGCGGKSEHIQYITQAPENIQRGEGEGENGVKRSVEQH